MKDFLIKLFMDINATLIRISRGRGGSCLGTQTILHFWTTRRWQSVKFRLWCLKWLN